MRRMVGISGIPKSDAWDDSAGFDFRDSIQKAAVTQVLMLFRGTAVRVSDCNDVLVPVGRIGNSTSKVLFLLLFIACAFISIAGCGTVTYRTKSPAADTCSSSSRTTASAPCPVRIPIAGVSFFGRVVAASQPVAEASVQLYAAGNTGNGSAPAALLPASLSTASDGSFTIPGEYSCPSSQTPVYLLSKGGQTTGSSLPNSSRWLMAALGPCGTISAGSHFVLNEVTTAASVWSLAPFMSSGGFVGASCTNTAGLDNAFLSARSLASLTTGSSPGANVPSTANVPTGKLNALANALSSCAGSAGGGSCAALFRAATVGDAMPANTVDAALNIAHAPANNAASIYALAADNPVFFPDLPAAPTDWMLPITISGGGMSLPTAVGVDGSGNVWVSSYLNAVSEFLPDGSPMFPSGINGNGINQSYGMALDPESNVWIANEQTTANTGTGDVTELDSAGDVVMTGLTSGGIDFPIAVTADNNGNVWFVDYGNSKVTLFDTSASALSGAEGWGGTFLTFPVALAVDSNHNAWVANQAGQLPVTKISADGSQITNFDCDCNGASGIATDQNDNVWITNYYGNSISEVNSCGKLVLDSAMGGGVQHPQAIGVDGAGVVWVTNYTGNSLSAIGGSFGTAPAVFLSPGNGFGTDATLNQPYGLAIDASGNIWVSNFGNNTLTEFVGIATPVKTPLAGPPQSP